MQAMGAEVVFENGLAAETCELPVKITLQLLHLKATDIRHRPLLGLRPLDQVPGAGQGAEKCHEDDLGKQWPVHQR